MDKPNYNNQMSRQLTKDGQGKKATMGTRKSSNSS